MSVRKRTPKFNTEKEITHIQYICRIIFGEMLLKLDTRNYGILYKDEFLENLGMDTIIDFKKVDLKKINLLAAYWKNRFLEIGENKKSKQLENALKGKSNLNIQDSITMIIKKDSTKDWGEDNFIIINSNTVYHQLRGLDLEKTITEREKLLLRGYCRTIPIGRLSTIFNLNDEIIKRFIAKYLENGNKSSGEELYARFLELPIKESLNDDLAKLSSLCYMLLPLKQFTEDSEKEENTKYKIDIDRDDRDKVLEDLKFLKNIQEDLYKKSTNKKLEEIASKLFSKCRKAYNTYVNNLKMKAKDLIQWKNSKNDPLYLVKILQESGLYTYDFDELSDILQDLKKESEDTLDEISKKSVIDFLKFLYESKEYKDKYKDRSKMAELLQICDVTEEDLNVLPDDESRKNQKGTFKNDMIELLQKRQKENISQMQAEEVRAIIDDYINSTTADKPKFLNNYIERLRALNALDLVTIIKLVNKGDMKNRDVIEFAIENDIDNETLNKFVYDIPEKTDIILQDFSDALNTLKLSKLYKEMRQAKDKKKENATKNFEKYAELFQTYKIDKDGKEIEKFLKEFKKNGKKDPTIPLSKEEVIYLYEIGLIEGKYALKPNSNINILNEDSQKYGNKVNDVMYEIISTVINDGKLKVEDAKDLFKNEIENLYSKSDNVTKEMLDGTLLGRFFKKCSNDQKFGIILACDFSNEISEKLILQYLPDTMESRNSNKKTKEDSKIIDYENKRKKKSYTIISYITRAKQILSLDMPKPELMINNGILLVRSDRLHICIIEQLYISNTEEQKLRTGEHPTYVMTTDYYEAHKEEFCKSMSIREKQKIIYNFSKLGKLAIRDSENGDIKKVFHKLEENNPKRNITPWEIALKNAVSNMCGKPIDYTENVSKINYQSLIGG